MIRAIARVLPAALLSAACYTYTPISPALVTSDMTVRVEFARPIGEERVEGRVFEVAEGSLSLVPEVRPGADTSPRVLLVSDIESLAAREFNSTRTLLIVGGGAAIGVGVLKLAGGTPGDTRGPGGAGDFNVMPILQALIGSN